MPHHAPRTLAEALDALQRAPSTVLAGGTDVFPALGRAAPARPLLDITRVQELRGVEGSAAAGWRLGATTTWTDIVRAPLPAAFDGLKAAARQVGACQIQNTGTLGGNLCTASPAADGIVALLALGAEVELVSVAGRRRVDLAAFITGARQTALAPGELLTAILVPAHRASASGVFAKLGARRYLVISIAMVSAVIEDDGRGRVAVARVAVGACSPVALRLEALEAALVGTPVATMAALVEPRHVEALSPIDDVRAPASYRRAAAVELVRRALAELAPSDERAAA